MQRKKRKGKTRWTELDLRQELSESIEAEWRGARLTFWVTDVLLYASIVLSIAATLVVSNGWLDNEIAAIIVVVPAIAIGLERSCKFNARSDWHYKYFLRLLAIWRRLRDEKITEVDASCELTRLDIEMDQAFPHRDFTIASQQVAKALQPAHNKPSDAMPR